MGSFKYAAWLVSELRSGPLHTMQDDTRPFTPDSFVDEERWTDDYLLEPYGFLAPPKLIRITAG